MSDHPARTERALHRRDLHADPMAQFTSWLGDAEAAGVPLPNAMGLATADAEGRPSVRHVLLRGVDDGFVFFTNYESRKGRQLSENPHAGLVLLWKALERQVNVTGTVARVSAEESEAYFRTRPREARVGAWASPQSRVLASREELDARVGEIEDRYPDEIPLPPFWGGYRLTPDSIEFWQGRLHRLHDRFRYSRDAGGRDWRVERLSP
jgi:pyridoxamine 5'-phosphate oxidase